MADELSIMMRLRGARAVNAELNQTAGSIGRLTAESRRASVGIMGMSRSLSRTGTMLTRNVTLPIAVGLGYAAKSSIDFSNKMRMVQTQAGATAGEVKRLTPQVLALTRISPQGPNDLADALFRIESHGIRGAHAMKVLRSATDLAMVGNSNLEDTTYALSAAVQTHIKGLGEDAHAAGVLNAIVGQGSMRMDELNGALSTGVLTSAKAFSLSIQDVGAALDTMTARGMPAQQSATRLRMSMSLLGAPSTKADKILQGIGLSGNMLAETMTKKNGLLESVKLLRDHMTGLDKAGRAQLLSHAFGGGRSSAAIIALVQNVTDYEKRLRAINKQQRQFNADVSAARAEPLNKLKIAWSSIQTDLIIIGGKIVPVIAHLANGIAKITDLLAGHPSIGLSFLAALMLLGPGLKIAALGIRLYGAAQALASGETFLATGATYGFSAALLACPITWIILGIAALIVVVVLIITHFKTFKRIVGDVWGWMKSHLKWVALFAPGLAVIILLVKHFNSVKHAVMAVFHWVEKMLGKLKHVPSALKGLGSSILHSIPGYGAASGIVGAVGGVLGHLAQGGPVMQTGPYLVGERGPEVVRLPAGAHVTPNDALGGELVTVPIQVTMDGRVVAQTVARVVADRRARS